ncbi:DUF2799 domain-containing protein [Microbulbifer aestuariivivens]
MGTSIVNTIKVIAVLAVAVFFLNGCATMSAEECVTADWRAIGYEDGAAGQTVAMLGKRRQACADHGVRPDTEAYRAGRAEGLTLYCTEMRGFRIGRAGGTYGGVCPRDLEDDFLAGYESGREIYQAQRAVNDVASAIRSAHNEREHLLDDITEMSAHLVSDEATKEERIELLADIARLKTRHTELGFEIEDMEYELALREAAFHEIQLRSPYR